MHKFSYNKKVECQVISFYTSTTDSCVGGIVFRLSFRECPAVLPVSTVS